MQLLWSGLTESTNNKLRIKYYFLIQYSTTTQSLTSFILVNFNIYAPVGTKPLTLKQPMRNEVDSADPR